MLNGISFDTGLTYIAGPPGRRWATHRPHTPRTLKRDMEFLRRAGAQGVRIHGEHALPLLRASQAALRAGLQAWLSPRYIGRPAREALAHVEALAAEAAPLHEAYPGRVVLMVANELTQDSAEWYRGDYEQRALALSRDILLGAHPRRTRTLNPWLSRLAAAARRNFRGPVTYAAPFWEPVDWTPFDIVSLNLYQDALSRWGYAGRLRRMRQQVRLRRPSAPSFGMRQTGKPLHVTEFGCARFMGASLLGGAAWRHFRLAPRRPGEQAGSVEWQWREIKRAGADGAFAFVYEMARCYPGDADGKDDRASYGLVDIAGGRVEPAPAFRRLRELWKEK
ncbi:MAG: hypothetical protein HY558_05345 [Euryarchaeota archaeon]|nr:hypothetical protein [Euryarchaeota archaeon]